MDNLANFTFEGNTITPSGGSAADGISLSKNITGIAIRNNAVDGLSGSTSSHFVKAISGEIDGYLQESNYYMSASRGGLPFAYNIDSDSLNKTVRNVTIRNETVRKTTAGYSISIGFNDESTGQVNVVDWRIENNTFWQYDSNTSTGGIKIQCRQGGTASYNISKGTT